MTFDTNCTYNCWECNNPCYMIQLFRLPEQSFNEQILNNLKSRAGSLIIQNYDPAEVQKDLEIKAVSLKIARELFLEKYHF